MKNLNKIDKQHEFSNSHEDVNIVLKYTKRCLTSPIIREMQTENYTERHIKGWKKVYHVNTHQTTKQKKARAAKLTSKSTSEQGKLPWIKRNST